MINFDKNKLFELFPFISEESKDLFACLVSKAAENVDFFKTFEQQHPVMHNGQNYGCISAVVLRARACTSDKPCVPFPLIQYELMSKNRGCVVIARPEEVKIIKVGKR